jgi:hypothetical protein
MCIQFASENILYVLTVVAQVSTRAATESSVKSKY